MTELKFNEAVQKQNLKFAAYWQKIQHKQYLRIGFGALAGTIVGLLYWNFIGCSGGTCPLTSNVYKTVIIFTFMGGLLAKK